MKCEIIGSCPCCINKKNSLNTDIFANRNEDGDITGMYIFGDDDFDVPTSGQFISEIKVSDDGKNIIEIVCPRCKEYVEVSVPVIKKMGRTLFRSEICDIDKNRIIEQQM